MSFFNNHNVCVIYKITCFAVIFKKMHQVTVNKSLIQVKMVLYKQGKEKAVLRFNAANSTNINWFSEANVLESPWEDLLTATKNYFTIEGPSWDTGCRDFHINHAYGTCSTDSGWLSIGNNHGCDWETRFAFGLKLIYSKIATYANYNDYSKFCH